MKRKLAFIIIAALLSSAAQAQTAPDSTQLAHRLVEDQAGGPDYVTDFNQATLAGFDRLTRNQQIPDLSGRRAALQQALTDSRSGILQLEDQLAGVYAANLSVAEMSGWTAFLESPDGKSIQAKKLQAGWPLGQPDLTPAEIIAERTFNTSATGQSIAARNNVILGQSAALMTAFQAKLTARVNNIYCQTSKTCEAGKNP